MKFSKLLVLLKSNLKLQIYRRETAKQKIINYRAEFPMKFIILCPETVSRNLPVPRQNPAKIIFKNLPNRHKNLSGQKRPKKPNFFRPLFKNKKRPNELKKGQKLQIWPQKSQTGNPAHLVLIIVLRHNSRVYNLPWRDGRSIAQ